MTGDSLGDPRGAQDRRPARRSRRRLARSSSWQPATSLPLSSRSAQMNNMERFLVYAVAAAHMLLMMMATIIESRKRKRDERRPAITYKRARNDDNEESGLIKAFKFGAERIAVALEKCAEGNLDLPSDLFQMVQDLPGFDDTHKSYYYSHLVENPHVGRAFYNAPFEYKLNFMAKWISEKFPG